MKYYTRKKTLMLPNIREAIIEVMTNPAHDGASQVKIAKLAGIHKRTLWNYLTDELWAEIKKRRLHVLDNAIELLDKSILTKALKGNIAAAKLMYSRWDKISLEEKGASGLAGLLKDLNE